MWRNAGRLGCCQFWCGRMTTVDTVRLQYHVLTQFVLHWSQHAVLRVLKQVHKRLEKDDNILQLQQNTQFIYKHHLLVLQNSVFWHCWFGDMKPVKSSIYPSDIWQKIFQLQWSTIKNGLLLTQDSPWLWISPIAIWSNLNSQHSHTLPALLTKPHSTRLYVPYKHHHYHYDNYYTLNHNYYHHQFYI